MLTLDPHSEAQGHRRLSLGRSRASRLHRRQNQLDVRMQQWRLL
jgi:hypothetical protein